jgi:hypothetical protein
MVHFRRKYGAVCVEEKKIFLFLFFFSGCDGATLWPFTSRSHLLRDGYYNRQL